MRSRYALILAFASLSLMAAKPDRRQTTDWPCWRGPEHTGISTETGLLRSWPDGGPQLVWSSQGAGEGLSTPSVAGNLLFVMGNRDNEEWLSCFNVADEGRQAWTRSLGPVRSGGGGYPGPRSTPTVDGKSVYALGLNGDLVCCDIESGEIRWQHNLQEQFGGSVGGWGYSESVLIDGDRLICTPGGSKSTMIALNKATGEEIWSCEANKSAHYASIVRAKIAGIDQYVQSTGDGIIGVAVKDGKLLWEHEHGAGNTANIATPVVSGDQVLVADGYGRGAVLLTVKKKGSKLQVEQDYLQKEFQNRTGGVLVIDGFAYGAHEGGFLTCMELASGDIKWKARDTGICSLIYADGMLIARSEGDRIFLIEADSNEYKLLGAFDQPQRSGTTAYPHPVVSNGMLYIRDQDVLLCYKVRDE